MHNAAAGYWTIAADCTRPYTSLSAGELSFGAGLLETCVQALTGNENVLLVAYDIDARGPLAPVARQQGTAVGGTHRLAASADRRRWRSSIGDRLGTRGLTPSRAKPENAALVAGNSTESCLPLMEALALGGTHDLLCLATPTLGLKLHLEAS